MRNDTSHEQTWESTRGTVVILTPGSGGNTYLGGEFDAFFNVFLYFWCFSGGMWDSAGGKSPGK